MEIINLTFFKNNHCLIVSNERGALENFKEYLESKIKEKLNIKLWPMSSMEEYEKFRQEGWEGILDKAESFLENKNQHWPIPFFPQYHTESEEMWLLLEDWINTCKSGTLIEIKTKLHYDCITALWAPNYLGSHIGIYNIYLAEALVELANKKLAGHIDREIVTQLWQI